MIVVEPTTRDAAAEMVQVEPRVRVVLLTVTLSLARSALLTRPVAVNELVTVKSDALALEDNKMSPVPLVPVTAYSPTTPLLS